MTQWFKLIVEKIRKRKLTREEEEDYDNFQDEVLIPTLKWSIIGIVLIFCLLKFAVDLIGATMIFLSLYLVYGILKFRKEFNRRLEALNEQISRQEKLFSTDMGSRVRNQFLTIALVTLFLVIYTITGIHQYERFSEFFSKAGEIWRNLSPNTKIDIAAVLFSFVISGIVLLTGVFKISQMSNLIITNEGLFISDSFISWGEIKSSQVEYFFKRPVHLVINTRGGSLIRIQLSRFNVDKKKAEEIATILQNYTKV